MSFCGFKVNIFFKNGILGDAFYKNFEHQTKLKGRKKSLAGSTLAMSALYHKREKMGYI
jgi:hypothetical protein